MIEPISIILDVIQQLLVEVQGLLTMKNYKMNNSIKTAIASFGMSGLVFHGPLLKVNQGFEVISIFERTKIISKKMFPDANIVRSYNDILQNPEIELVIVNTPDRFHYEMVKAALQSGKHVVVEKPITQQSGQAEELIQLAKKEGLVFTVFQNRRWDGDFRTVQKYWQKRN